MDTHRIGKDGVGAIERIHMVNGEKTGRLVMSADALHGMALCCLNCYKSKKFVRILN